MAGNIGQLRAEGKSMYLRPAHAPLVGHRVQEMQDYAAILAHGAGNIAQHDQIGPTWFRCFEGQRIHLAAPLHRRTHRAGHVHPALTETRRAAPGRQRLDGQPELGQHPLRLRHLRKAHLLEIESLEPLGGGHGERGVNLDHRVFFPVFFGLFLLWRFGTVQQRFCRTLLGRLCRTLFLHPANRR